MPWDRRLIARHPELLAERHNLSATAAPAVTDDEDSNYGYGSVWIDTTAGAVYICVDPTSGAASWLLVGPVAGSGDVTGPAAAVDSNIAEFDGATGKLIKDSLLTHANASDAISKKHTQGTDQKLDDGGANEVTAVNAKDAVNKKHTQNTDTILTTDGATALINAGTLKANLGVDALITVDGRDVSVDGAKLDTIENSAVALATVKGDADVADAIATKHTQGTDQFLDSGGANQCAVADVKDAVDKKHAEAHGANHTNGTDDVAIMTGDAGAGGTKGLVPAQGAGDYAAGKYLDAGGNWSIPGSRVYGPYNVDHADASPLTLFEIPARSMVKNVYIENSETDAGGVDWEVGVAGDTTKYAADGAIPSTNGDYISNSVDILETAAVNAIATINAAGTAGKIRIWFEIVSLPTS